MWQAGKHERALQTGGQERTQGRWETTGFALVHTWAGMAAKKGLEAWGTKRAGRRGGEFQRQAMSREKEQYPDDEKIFLSSSSLKVKTSEDLKKGNYIKSLLLNYANGLIMYMCVCIHQIRSDQVTQSCPTLCDPMTRTTPGGPLLLHTYTYILPATFYNHLEILFHQNTKPSGAVYSSRAVGTPAMAFQREKDHVYH